MHLRTSAGLFCCLSIFSAASADASPQEVNLRLRSLPGAPVRTAVLQVDRREVSLDQIVRVRITDTDRRRVWSVVGTPREPTAPSTPPPQNNVAPAETNATLVVDCANTVADIESQTLRHLGEGLRAAALDFMMNGSYDAVAFEGQSIASLAEGGAERDRLRRSCPQHEGEALRGLRRRVRVGFDRLRAPFRSLEEVNRRSLESLDVNTVQPTPGYSRLAITACAATPIFHVVRQDGTSSPIGGTEELSLNEGERISVGWNASTCTPEAAYTFNIVEPDGPITLTPGFIVPIFVGGATRLFDLGSSIGQESSGAGFAAPQPAVFLHMRLLANSNHHWALGAFLGSSIGSRAGMMWSLGLSLMAYQRLMIGVGAVVDFEGDMRRSSMDEGVSFADSTESFARGGFAINIGLPLDIVRALTPSASTGATQNPASN